MNFVLATLKVIDARNNSGAGRWNINSLFMYGTLH